MVTVDVRSTGPGRRGFSATELLVVVGVVGLVIALLVPAIRGAREAARRTQCANDLRQLGQALHHYLDMHRSFPPGYVSATSDGREVGPGWGWGSQMLAQLEQSFLMSAINFDLPVEDRANLTAHLRLKTMICPAAPPVEFITVRGSSGGDRVARLAAGTFVGSAGTDGTDGVFARNRMLVPEDVADGLGQTFVFGERSWSVSGATWTGAPPGFELCTAPGSPTRDCRPSSALVLGVARDRPNDPSAADGFGSQHPGGAQFALGDGSVRFVPDTIQPRVFRALATRSGGEMIDADGD
jgi:hypothetical protein